MSARKPAIDRLLAIFDDAPIGAIVIDRAGRVVYVNRRQCENSRLRREDFVGKDYRATFRSSLERAGLLAFYDRLVERGEPFEMSLPYYRRHSDDSLLTFTMRGYRFESHFVLLTNVDAALAAQQARYEKLFENANDGIFILSRDGRFLAANQKFAEMTGVPREEMLGKTTEMFLPGRFRQSLARIERILEEGSLGPYELEISTPLGRRFISLNGFALIEDGKPVGVMNIARDTTGEHERAEMRETLYELSQDLARSLDVSDIARHLFARTKGLLGADSGLLLLADPNGQALRPVAGYGEASDWSLLAGGEPATAAAELALAREALERRETVGRTGMASRAAAAGASRSAPASAWAVPLTSGAHAEGVLLVGYPEGREPGSLRLLRLLANESAQAVERARLADALRAARDKALEASRLKSSFLANMSHEIRTPLNVILGFSTLLGERLGELGDEDAATYATGMQRAGERLLATIHGILDISKIEARAFEIHPVPLDLPAITRRLAGELALLAREKGLELSCDVAVPRAVVRFDEYCLSHALMNLLQNAIKFTQRGGVSVRLDRGSAGDLRLDVADTGIGIGAEHLARLFEPFTQEESGPTRRFEGSGLGLALTKSYLEMNGARLAVESRKGVGSRFTILFPPGCEIADAAGGDAGDDGMRVLRADASFDEPRRLASGRSRG